MESRSGLDLIPANALSHAIALLATMAAAWLGRLRSSKIAALALIAILTASWMAAGMLALFAGLILALATAFARA